eukprot:COSAG06_NODE_63569_length_262_cov_0.601227_1_plen_44_part_10
MAEGTGERIPMRRFEPAPSAMMTLLLLSGALLCAAESASLPNDE